MANYLSGVGNKRATAQSEPIAGTTQERNDAGGYAWRVDKWKQLERFLVIGTEGGTYYVNQKALTARNVTSLSECIAEDGSRVVELVTAISDRGRAPSNDPALFALAQCAASKDDKTRSLALAALPKVARIGTHLLHFLDYVDGARGWGRGLRRAVGAWFTERKPEQAAYQILKYGSRDKWALRDALRLAHPKIKSAEHQAVLRWAIGSGPDHRTVSKPGRGRVFAVCKEACVLCSDDDRDPVANPCLGDDPDVRREDNKHFHCAACCDCPKVESA